jgi:hypothetical protein
MIDKLIDKWEKIGLTDGMDEEKIPKLVKLYEEAAVILTNELHKDDENYIETITFPVIYRVVRDTDIDTDIMPEEIIKTIKHNFSNILTHINMTSAFQEIDGEAEAVKQICDKIIENIKNKTK